MCPPADIEQAATDPLARHACSAAELKRLIEVERDRQPFVVYRDDAGELQIHVLPEGGSAVTIGRREGADVRISWDSQLSRVHAELRRLGGEWTVADDGLSTNGTFVNARRISGRHRLRDEDRLRVGRTMLVFKSGESAATEGESTPPDETATGDVHPEADELTATQRSVLVALCRPLLTGDRFAGPASNQQIANEVHLSLDAVKTALRLLYARFGLKQRADNKRGALAQFALHSGLVSRQDLGGRH